MSLFDEKQVVDPLDKYEKHFLLSIIKMVLDHEGHAPKEIHNMMETEAHILNGYYRKTTAHLQKKHFHCTTFTLRPCERQSSINLGKENASKQPFLLIGQTYGAPAGRLSETTKLPSGSVVWVVTDALAWLKHEEKAHSGP